MFGGIQQIQYHLVEYTTSYIQPGIQYFNEFRRQKMQTPLATLSAVRLFFYLKSKQKQQKKTRDPLTAAVDSQPVFPFFWMIKCS